MAELHNRLNYQPTDGRETTRPVIVQAECPDIGLDREAETYRWMPLPYMGSVARKDKCLVLQGMFGLTAFKDYLQ